MKDCAECEKSMDPIVDQDGADEWFETCQRCRKRDLALKIAARYIPRGQDWNSFSDAFYFIDEVAQ